MPGAVTITAPSVAICRTCTKNLRFRGWEYILYCGTLNLPLQASSVLSEKTQEETEYTYGEEDACAFGLCGSGGGGSWGRGEQPAGAARPDFTQRGFNPGGGGEENGSSDGSSGI